MSDRFRFALKAIEPAQWQRFERLASTFVSDEMGTLRTLASPTGDEGRDATIWQPVDDPQIALQYSVQADWQSKIRRTAKRLADRHDDVRTLVYLTPFEIGAASDSVRRTVRQDFHLYLDVRDRHWFAERENRSPTTQAATAEFCRAIADPLLATAGVIDPTGSNLSNDESRAALLYLVLQRDDDDLDRHLTRLCYDALVKAVLRDTDNDHLMSRNEIASTIRELLPSHSKEDVELYVDRALSRLTKRSIRHWKQKDSFCLTFEERTHLSDGLARLALLNEQFEGELTDNLHFIASGLGLDIHLVNISDLLVRTRRVMERFLFERGESFVESLRTGQAMLFVDAELMDVASLDLAHHPDTSSLRTSCGQLVALTIERTILSPTDNVQTYLRAMSDAYTLFAFMLETPNVQSAVTKLFAHGDFWLDTTAVLPILAETLLEPSERSYSRLISAAQAAGAKFFLTEGVVDEISAHMDAARRAWRGPQTWKSRTPFLLASHIWSGRLPADFPHWLENFRGSEHPEEDLIVYLRDELRFGVRQLRDYVTRADDQLRWHSQEYWREVHERRRSSPGSNASDDVLRQLVDHDVENFLGVLERRRGEQVGNPFGYSTWWLTLDRQAPAAASEIAKRCGMPRLDSPALSFDFLTYYLAVGPARRELEKSRERSLPIAVDTSLLDALPADLLAAAEQARNDIEGQDERVIRRKIRDHLEKEKLRQGRIGKAGLDAIHEDIRLALEARSGTTQP